MRADGQYKRFLLQYGGNEHRKPVLQTDKYNPDKRILLRRDDLDNVEVDFFGSVHDVSIHIVDGLYIRNYLDTQWVFAGHSARDLFIPENSIWIEQIVQASELAPTLAHEWTEMQVMTYDGIDYETAHEIATRAERAFRASYHAVIKNPLADFKAWEAAQ